MNRRRVVQRTIENLYGPAVPTDAFLEALDIARAVEDAVASEARPRVLPAPVDDTPRSLAAPGVLPPCPCGRARRREDGSGRCHLCRRRGARSHDPLDRTKAPARGEQENEVMAAAMPLIANIVRRRCRVEARIRPYEDEVVDYANLFVLERVRQWARARGDLRKWIAISTRYAILEWKRENRVPDMGIKLPRRCDKETAKQFAAPVSISVVPDFPLYDDGNYERSIVEDEKQSERMAKEASLKIMLELIRGLPARVREILVRYYDLDGKGTEPLATIAESMGISESRACQLKAKGEKTLKRELTAARGRGML